ncbi:MAG: DMT family transporter [Deinococcota bacterium]
MTSPPKSAANSSPQSALTQQLSMTKLTWSLLVTLSILWGGSFFFIEVALRSLPTLTVVFGRVALAACALHLYVLATGKRMPTTLTYWRGFLVMGCLNNFVPFILSVWGQSYISGGLASILNATTPISAVLLAHFFTKDEPMTTNKLMGVVLGLLGVVVLVGPTSLQGSSNLLAQLAIIASGISYSFAGIYARRFKGLPTTVIAAGMLTGSSIMMLPLSLMIDQPWQLRPELVSVLALCALAIISTAAAYLIYFYILAVAGATNVLLVALLAPVSAILLGVVILGEALGPLMLAGMSLILLGLLAVDGRLLSFLPKRLKTIFVR